MKLFDLRAPIALVLAGGLLLAGCARKSTQAPPMPPPVPGESAPSPPSSTPPSSGGTSSEAPSPDASSLLQPAFFDLDSYMLNESARGALDRDARALRENPSLRVTIEGHCDERGTAEYNQALGERRAVAARDYLIAAGINGSRMQIISYGKERPFAMGSDESSWAQNRRAHFVSR